MSLREASERQASELECVRATEPEQAQSQSVFRRSVEAASVGAGKALKPEPESYRALQATERTDGRRPSPLSKTNGVGATSDRAPEQLSVRATGR